MSKLTLRWPLVVPLCKPGERKQALCPALPVSLEGQKVTPREGWLLEDEAGNPLAWDRVPPLRPGEKKTAWWAKNTGAQPARAVLRLSGETTDQDVAKHHKDVAVKRKARPSNPSAEARRDKIKAEMAARARAVAAAGMSTLDELKKRMADARAKREEERQKKSGAQPSTTDQPANRP